VSSRSESSWIWAREAPAIESRLDQVAEETGADLGITEAAIGVHRGQIMRKMQARFDAAGAHQFYQRSHQVIVTPALLTKSEEPGR
jgi:hypothetical protein